MNMQVEKQLECWTTNCHVRNGIVGKLEMRIGSRKGIETVETNCSPAEEVALAEAAAAPPLALSNIRIRSLSTCISDSPSSYVTSLHPCHQQLFLRLLFQHSNQINS